MSLSGLRDISIIETPPIGRRPIRTTVGEYDDELVKTALEREHARGGQAFYLHNRVESIDEAATKLEQLCPALLVAHGQMSERELEERMHAFLAGDADVLVSTTIIESGIDIPRRTRSSSSVPMRSDSRSSTRSAGGSARTSSRTPTSSTRRRRSSHPRRARLATLADHTELGSGFQIAMRDLEIRGAGDLLGPSSPGTSPRSGSSSTSRCSTRPWPSSPEAGASSPAPFASTLASTHTCRPPTSRPRR